MIPFIYKYKLKTLEEFDTEYTFDANTHLLLLGGERTGKTTLAHLLVNKFLTREQTYSLLLTAVNENEKKVEHLREENDKKEEILHNLQIDNDNQ